MVVSVEVARALADRGHDAKFVATGQTGILIEGDGCPVDCVVSDFLNGAVEKLVLANQHHDILLVEGQGSITHPRYSPVSLGLMHGQLPHGMILCYEAGRGSIVGMDDVPLVPLSRLRNLYETTAGIMHPSRMIALALNGRLLSENQVKEERARVGDELGLPVCDVYRDGPDKLVDAVLAPRGRRYLENRVTFCSPKTLRGKDRKGFTRIFRFLITFSVFLPTLLLCVFAHKTSSTVFYNTSVSVWASCNFVFIYSICR